MQSTNILPQNWKTTLSKVIAKTWIDENFRQRFVKEPLATLKDFGLVLEDSMKVTVNHSYTASGTMSICCEEGTVYQVELPGKPSGLGEEQINFWTNAIYDAKKMHQALPST